MSTIALKSLIISRMNTNKKLVRIIAIGSIFLIFLGSSIFGTVSLQKEVKINDFWLVKTLIPSGVQRAYADDDEGEWHSRRSNSTSTTQVTPPSTNIQSSTVTTTPTPTTTCTTVFDTVTSPSGTTSQVPRQVCTTSNGTTTSTPVIQNTPVQVVQQPVVTDPISTLPVVSQILSDTTSDSGSVYSDGTYAWNGVYSYPGWGATYTVELIISGWKISQARFISFMVSGNGTYTQADGNAALQALVNTQNPVVNTISWATGTSNAIQNAINEALSKARKIAPALATQSGTTVPALAETHVTPNGKTYIIHKLWENSYIFERADGTLSTTKFSTSSEVIAFIDRNNRFKELQNFTAPNKKTYLILQDIPTGIYLFKRSDGTLGSKLSRSKDTILAYISSNNPAQPVLVKKTSKPAPVLVKKSTLAQVIAKVAAPAKPVLATAVATPVVAAPVTQAPKVDTVAKAS